MLDIPTTAFGYLAFDAESRKPLAYGMTADEARKRAMEIVPGAQLQVLVAGQYGRTVWNRNFRSRAHNRLSPGLEGGRPNNYSG